jgi:hypothetical protein
MLRKGDKDGALIHCITIVNEEKIILVHDTLITALDQLKNKGKDIHLNGITDDIEQFVNIVIFCSTRYDYKELVKFAKLLKKYLDKKLFNEFTGN